MKNIITLLVIQLPFFLLAQEFNFEVASEHQQLEINIKKLANDLLKIENDTIEPERTNSIFISQVITEDYDKALKNLKKIRDYFKEDYSDFSNVIWIAYEIYAKLKLENRSVTDQLTFETAFENSINHLTNQVTKEDAFYQFTNRDDKNLLESLPEFVSIEKKKYSLQQSRQICRSYLDYLINNSIGPMGLIYKDKYNKKRYIFDDKQMIKMTDGTVLSSVIVRKTDNKPKPVVLHYSIYPSESIQEDFNWTKYSINFDYVSVLVDSRGKRKGTGNIISFEKENTDLYEVIDWISKQSWCNGNVVMLGGSYLGFSQWAATKKLHPALKTIVPMVSVGPGIDYPMYNNVFMSYMLRWIHLVENKKHTDYEDFGNEKRWDSIYNQWYQKGIAFKNLDSLEGRSNQTFQKWISHPSYDKYWQNMIPYKEDFREINIPVLTITGYYDSDQQGALHYFKNHYKFNKNPEHYLIIGPYDHGGAQSNYPNKVLRGYELDKVAYDLKPLDLAYKWFNHVVKDSVKPDELVGKINYQVMESNKWKHADQMSKIANDTLRFYLEKNSEIEGKTHLLTSKKPNKIDGVKSIVDFKDRSYSLDFEKFSVNIIDTTLTNQGRNVYVSEMMDEDFEINGSFNGSLDLIINKKDLDITIQLYELKPDGRYFYLSSYLARASYAENRSKRTLLTPNTAEQIPIKNASFTSKKVTKGSKIVITVAVNKSKNWQINYGTGKDVSTETIKDATIPLKVEWLNSSYINIPVFTNL